MDELTKISDGHQAQAWLQQFSLGDRTLAKKLLDAFCLVSRDDFIDHMRTMLLSEAECIDGRVALYAERELGHRQGKPHRLFKEARRVPQRASGAAGPAAVKPTKSYDPSVGSEGIVAQMISELCHEFPKKFLNHPGPDQIRRKHVRSFWVVTDLIGSGDRARRYLEAAWRVRSVRSWWSGQLIKFSVMAYSATESGQRYVSRHPSHPEVHIVLPCPTIDTTFSKPVAEQMKRLCTVYNPTEGELGRGQWVWSGPSLGYASTGALLIFAHGAPNNVPLMFHKASKKKKNPWTPLFPARVSASISKDHYGIGLTTEKINARLIKLGQHILAKSNAVMNSDIPTGQIFLLLGALSRPPRLNDRILAGKVGLPSHELNKLLKEMTAYGWIDSQRRVTDKGVGQLAHAKKQLQLASNAMPVGNHEPQPYYPSSLRRPV
ncbi:phosphoribosyltransferase-like protein [Pseudomonas rustica]|uniref:phosphoribosyltransferase-like protein n=1 Tax=Pseudomonas rustica TaxID=2827099 RepID=UPI003CE835C2